MGTTNKVSTIILTLIIVTSSLLLLPLADAQTIPEPSVPEFTLSLVGPAYVVPTTYHLDQNTGQIVADIGYTNEYSYVEVKIKNQPLVFDYSNVHLIGAFGFYYNIQVKPHSSSQWVDIYHAWDYGYGVPSNSEYSTLSFSIEGQMGVGVLAGTQIDIHVQAMIGEIAREINPNATSAIDMFPYTFHGETSEWSSIQTIDISANVLIASDFTPSPSSTLPNMGPTASPISNNAALTLTLTLIVLAIFVVVIVSLLLYVRYLKRSMQRTNFGALSRVNLLNKLELS